MFFTRTALGSIPKLISQKMKMVLTGKKYLNIGLSFVSEKSVL